MRELNPLLLLGLQMGDLPFLILKFSVTGLALLILILHWNFVLGRGTVRVSWLIRVLISAYFLVVTYEVLLMTLLHG
jgi:hypothetical protein